MRLKDCQEIDEIITERMQTDPELQPRATRKINHEKSSISVSCCLSHSSLFIYMRNPKRLSTMW